MPFMNPTDQRSLGEPPKPMSTFRAPTPPPPRRAATDESSDEEPSRWDNRNLLSQFHYNYELSNMLFIYIMPLMIWFVYL